MAHSGAGDDPQTIALSSNDWDYTFDTGNEHPVAGNPLGDHTIGAYFKATGSDNNISTLVTLDGDFDITFTLAESNQSEFGVYAIDEDGTRNADQRANMDQMTNSFWYRDETYTDFLIGGTLQSDAHTFADGSVVKIERRDGTIKVYDDDVEVHTYGTTYSGTMRFAKGDPGPAEADYDDFKMVDYAKIQRDGFLNEGKVDQSGFGNNQANAEAQGTEFIATRSGYIETITMDLRTVDTSFNAHCELWSSDGTNPVAQIGSDSDTIALDSTGQKTFTFSSTDAIVEKGKKYWWVTIDTSGGSGWVNPQHVHDSYKQASGTGRHDTITSIQGHATASVDTDRSAEIKINTSAGEPTPDFETLLLVHSDTSDASSSFSDSSQVGATITAHGNVQHDTAQDLGFGSSSILFDGSGDYLSVPSNSQYTIGTGPFTFDAIVRPTTSVASVTIVSNRGSGATVWYFGTGGSGNLILASNTIYMTTSSALSVDTTYHVALVRLPGSNRTDIYINGTTDANATVSQNFSTDAQLFLGYDGGGQNNFNGWMKEPRFSLTARWDANFTPPTSAYP